MMLLLHCARVDIKMAKSLDREKQGMVIKCCCLVCIIVRENLYASIMTMYDSCSEMDLNARVITNVDIQTNR